jgi:opacity protein-like surface antigen
MTVDLSDGFEYHVVGGVDYYVNDRFSMYVDARYVWAESKVDIRIDGAHQVRMPAFDDGRLQIFSEGSATAPILWEDGGLTGCPTCAQDGLFATEDANGNRTLDTLLGEGTGVLYLYNAGPNQASPFGTWQSSEMVGVIDCSATPATCPWINGSQLDSEDRNLNGYMDRYLSWGVDICSMPGGSANPICANAETTIATRYVWPAGCGTTISQATESNRLAEGCPPIPPTGADNTFTTTGADNESDIYLIQGGKINLGGFSLGMGVKFTF